MFVLFQFSTWSFVLRICFSPLLSFSSDVAELGSQVDSSEMGASLLRASQDHFSGWTIDMDLGSRGHARSCINSCPGCSAQVQFLKPSQELYSSALPLRTAVLLMSLRNQLSSALSGPQQILLPVILCFP